MISLESCFKMTEKELYDYITENYNPVLQLHDSVLIQGESPVLLVAHLDTVFREPVKEIIKILNDRVWSSPQGIGGDDRCGVYALLKIYEQSEIKPWLLFCCHEEKGGVGANEFTTYLHTTQSSLLKPLYGLKMIIEIDRRGGNEAVYYECGNFELKEYIEKKGFITKTGSFSDICVIAPALDVAAVNLSAGYYKNHTTREYVNVPELEHVIETVTEIVWECTLPNTPYYPYVEIYNEWYEYNFADYPYFL